MTKTEATGKRLDEAKKINTSLLALGNVIFALSSGGKEVLASHESQTTFAANFHWQTVVFTCDDAGEGEAYTV